MKAAASHGLPPGLQLGLSKDVMVIKLWWSRKKNCSNAHAVATSHKPHFVTTTCEKPALLVAPANSSVSSCNTTSHSFVCQLWHICNHATYQTTTVDGMGSQLTGSGNFRKIWHYPHRIFKERQREYLLWSRPRKFLIVIFNS